MCHLISIAFNSIEKLGPGKDRVAIEGQNLTINWQVEYVRKDVCAVLTSASLFPDDNWIHYCVSKCL